ncbi:MAG: hypothetical protein KZQ71_13360 [Candidatus Thiodiazotropha sp. (ex Lucinoma aequizonata)]|nr:hypothetical protein [Candidatus Thiodiazotropha sp. (ex Lucinoma aequizonata)]MCU7909488.1 hypothetical protein [Candidatus Thiodiazotropha sp. (ex Lucinoma aequizonata)]
MKDFGTSQSTKIDSIFDSLVTIQPILPWPTRLGLMHLHEIRFFALKKQC